jgi:DHA1 family bicyclomycin/chloramphenicol resistance-like MFS transporter
MDKRALRIAVILGALSALGPLAIDMYLPALPMMVSDLATNDGAVQRSLMSFFIGLTLGQLVYGPVSDKVGRKPVIYVGLALFTLGSIGCAMATSIEQLTLLRLVQGLGGSIGMVIGMAVVRDLYTGALAGRLMALMIMVLGIAPILAPLFGSVVLSVTTWHVIFIVLAIYGVVAIAVVARYLPESRMPELRAVSHPSAAFKHYAGLLVSSKFIPYVLALALAQAGFFAYLSASSFVFISLHGLSPMTYSIIFGVNAVGLIAGAQLNARYVRKHGAANVVRCATVAYAIAAVVLALADQAGYASLPLLCVLLFVVITSMGFLLPPSTMLAMEAHGAIAGTAAALMGAFQFGLGAVGSAVVAALADGTAAPMLGVIAGCGVAAALVANLAFPKRTAPAGAGAAAHH